MLDQGRAAVAGRHALGLALMATGAGRGAAFAALQADAPTVVREVVAPVALDGQFAVVNARTIPEVATATPVEARPLRRFAAGAGDLEAPLPTGGVRLVLLVEGVQEALTAVEAGAPIDAGAALITA